MDGRLWRGAAIPRQRQGTHKLALGRRVPGFQRQLAARGGSTSA